MLSARPPHSLAVAGHNEPSRRYIVRREGLFALGEQLRGVSKEGMSQHPLFGRWEGGLGERIETLPQGFLQGAWGTFFGLQRMSPKVFPATAAGNLPHKRMALRNCSAKDWQKQISQYATPQ